MGETKRTGQEGYGMALAGVIVGGVVVGLAVLWLLFVVAAGASSGWTWATT